MMNIKRVAAGALLGLLVLTGCASPPEAAEEPMTTTPASAPEDAPGGSGFSEREKLVAQTVVRTQWEGMTPSDRLMICSGYLEDYWGMHEAYLRGAEYNAPLGMAMQELIEGECQIPAPDLDSVLEDYGYQE